MKGLSVKCPSCKQVYFETTDKYNPDVTPNGSMVKSLVPYAIDWLETSTTLVSEMTCPECGALLAPNGKLLLVVTGESKLPPVIDETATIHDDVDVTVIHPPETQGESRLPELTCLVCNKSFKNAFGLNGHKRTHAPKKEKK